MGLEMGRGQPNFGSVPLLMTAGGMEVRSREAATDSGWLGSGRSPWGPRGRAGTSTGEVGVGAGRGIGPGGFWI